jgi:hypothetical protein
VEAANQGIDDQKSAGDEHHRFDEIAQHVGMLQARGGGRFAGWDRHDGNFF